MPPLRSMSQSLMSFWHCGRKVERAAYEIGALLMASGLVHLAILVASGGSWLGPLSLRKPTTFGLSFGLTLITVTWVASFLNVRERTRAALLAIFTVACVLETVSISLQAWRGVPSHFNVATPFDALVTRFLAVGGLTLVVIIFLLTVASFRTNPTIPVSLRVAIRIGFLALCGAVTVGSVMIAKGMSLVFAQNPQAAYVTGGALKPTHAVTMHAILLLPALAWLLSFVAWSEQRRLRLVLLATIGYVLVAAVVAVENFDNVELRDMPFLAAALALLGVLLLVGSGTAALIGATRSPTSPGIQHSTVSIDSDSQLPFSATTTPADSFHRSVSSREQSPHSQNDSITRFSGFGS